MTLMLRWIANKVQICTVAMLPHSTGTVLPSFKTRRSENELRKIASVVYQIFLQIAIISAKWISNDCWLKIGVCVLFSCTLLFIQTDTSWRTVCCWWIQLVLQRNILHLCSRYFGYHSKWDAKFIGTEFCNLSYVRFDLVFGY